MSEYPPPPLNLYKLIGYCDNLSIKIEFCTPSNGPITQFFLFFLDELHAFNLLGNCVYVEIRYKRYIIFAAASPDD